MGKKERILELVELLNKASESYYAKDEEIMSNFEYDALYDELVSLEEETGIQYANSPTRNVGYEASDYLPKVKHEKPMLSLQKTKSVDELAAFLEDKEGVLSWKLDGLTVVLTYENGRLVSAVTRGDGETGEKITKNAETFENLPLKIDFKGRLVLRGEAVISYSDFEKINAEIEDDAEKYKNPRNLCSGSVRQLDPSVTKKRHVKVIIFSLVSAEDKEFSYITDQFDFLETLGFSVVPHYKVTAATIGDRVSQFAKDIKDYEIPSDGLVLIYDDYNYGLSLGMTAKYPRNAIAFKWQDETRETVLREIEWSPSRTGLINPVAVFDAVELEGTSVKRASVHNVSVLKSLKLGIGDHIMVYKANMIIPQIAENLTMSDSLTIPDSCPICGGKTEIRAVKEAKSLYCTNPECPAKQIKKFTHFVSRDALNVEGLSEQTLEKFVDMGFIKDLNDIFFLDKHKEAIVGMDGFGEKSYENLMESIDKARTVTPARLIYSLGIDNIGLQTAKLLLRSFNNDLDAFLNADSDQLSVIEGIGPVIANSVKNFFSKESNLNLLEEIRKELIISDNTVINTDSLLAGKTVVITGSLEHYENRDLLKEEIEALGGKVSGSVSKNTFVLINNDIHSTSSKNKKAKELDVPIVTEDEFIEKYLK